MESRKIESEIAEGNENQLDQGADMEKLLANWRFRSHSSMRKDSASSRFPRAKLGPIGGVKSKCFSGRRHSMDANSN